MPYSTHFILPYSLPPCLINLCKFHKRLKSKLSAWINTTWDIVFVECEMWSHLSLRNLSCHTLFRRALGRREQRVMMMLVNERRHQLWLTVILSLLRDTSLFFLVMHNLSQRFMVTSFYFLFSFLPLSLLFFHPSPPNNLLSPDQLSVPSFPFLPTRRSWVFAFLFKVTQLWPPGVGRKGAWVYTGGKGAASGKESRRSWGKKWRKDVEENRGRELWSVVEVS